MDTAVRYVDLCGRCERGRCRFFVRVVPSGKRRVLTCTGRGKFISGIQGFIETEIVNPADLFGATHNRLYCTNTQCEALIFGEQAPGMRFSVNQYVGQLCYDCIQEIDELSKQIPGCNHREAIQSFSFGPSQTSNADETNHCHWLALPHTWCGEKYGIEPGVYCDPSMIPEHQQVSVSMWQTFKLESTDIDEVRSVFDHIGLQNDMLAQMLVVALDEALGDTDDFVAMLLGDDEEDDDEPPDENPVVSHGPS